MPIKASRPFKYILVRKDLPVYVQMMNVAHAVGKAIRSAPISKRTIVRLLHVADEAELLVYHDRLVTKGYHVGLVREPEPYSGAAMAFAVEPLTERVNGIAKVVTCLRTASKSYCPVCNCVLDDGRCTGCMYGR